VDAVGAARVDEVRPVVEDEERAGGVGGRPELARGRDQRVVAERLVAQLDQVHPAAQRRVEQRPGAGVAHEVQARRGDPLAGAHPCVVKHAARATLPAYGSPQPG
jgi:hypothetical protein